MGHVASLFLPSAAGLALVRIRNKKIGLNRSLKRTIFKTFLASALLDFIVFDAFRLSFLQRARKPSFFFNELSFSGCYKRLGECAT